MHQSISKAGWLRVASLWLGIALFAACATPANIVYFQDTQNESKLNSVTAQPIRLQPSDQISIVVNSRDAQITAMFNLPYYTKRLGEKTSLTSGSEVSSNTAGICGYTIDSKGDIDFPIIGSIHLEGLTREEAQELIKELLIESRQIKDPVVVIEFMNLGFSILGEVVRPGRYSIDRDRFTILDALGRAGDLTINGERENITLVRHNGDADVLYRLNLLDIEQLYSSPAFYVQQGDVIYVTPNEKKQRESTVNGNVVYSASFWVSLGSLAMTLTNIIINLAK